jgi:hypothetical protein
MLGQSVYETNYESEKIQLPIGLQNGFYTLIIEMNGSKVLISLY